MACIERAVSLPVLPTGTLLTPLISIAERAPHEAALFASFVPFTSSLSDCDVRELAAVGRELERIERVGADGAALAEL